MAILASLTVVSYNHALTFFTYMGLIVYSLLRSYFWIDDKFRWLRFNLYLASSLILLYVYSRSQHRQVREKFQLVKEQDHSLNLFQSLIKVHHDGLIMTRNEKVVYSNKRVQSIFNLSKVTDSPALFETGLVKAL